MKMLDCDVCDRRLPLADAADSFINVVVPATYNDDNEPVELDICTPQCLTELGRLLGGGEKPDNEPTLDFEGTSEVVAGPVAPDPRDFQGAPFAGAYEGGVTVR